MIIIDTSYCDPDGSVRSYTFWRNLIEHIHTTDQLSDALWKRIFGEIAKYNGRYEKGGHIIFEKDSDSTQFLLRWS